MGLTHERQPTMLVIPSYQSTGINGQQFFKTPNKGLVFGRELIKPNLLNGSRALGSVEMAMCLPLRSLEKLVRSSSSNSRIWASNA